MDGFGSELSFAAVLMIIAKVAADIIVKWRERKQVVEVVNGNNRQNGEGGNPVKSGSTSTNLMLYMLKQQEAKLEKLDGGVTKLNEEMTDVKVDIGKIKTKLEMK